MRRQVNSLRSLTTVLLAGGLAGGLAACGGGSGGGSSSPPVPLLSGEALDMAITADPPSTAPDLLSADGSGTPADNTMLEEMADAARTKIDGWADTVYERTTASDSTDTFVIYSNKEAPKDTPFSDVYPFDHDADNDAANDSLIVGMNDVGTITSVTSFPNAGTRTEVQYPDGEELAGTFAEVQGTYTCVSGCSLSGESDGSFDAIGGDWYFTPANESDPVPVPDSDYVHFGYWMNESGEDDQPVIMAAAIAGGTAESAIGTVQDLEGRATYTGAATGLYVIRTYTLDGDIDSRTGGQFTADAMLTAHFGGDDVAVNKHYSITGTIEDFMDRGGRAIDRSWTVDLEAALFGSQQGAMFGGETVGDTVEGTGAWSGRFFGPVEVDNDDATSGNQSTFPSAVAGTFDAQFTNGAVIGAFGAVNDE